MPTAALPKVLSCAVILITYVSAASHTSDAKMRLKADLQLKADLGGALPKEFRGSIGILLKTWRFTLLRLLEPKLLATDGGGVGSAADACLALLRDARSCEAASERALFNSILAAEEEAAEAFFASESD